LDTKVGTLSDRKRSASEDLVGGQVGGVVCRGKARSGSDYTGTRSVLPVSGVRMPRRLPVTSRFAEFFFGKPSSSYIRGKIIEIFPCRLRMSGDDLSPHCLHEVTDLPLDNVPDLTKSVLPVNSSSKFVVPRFVQSINAFDI